MNGEFSKMHFWPGLLVLLLAKTRVTHWLATATNYYQLKIKTELNSKLHLRFALAVRVRLLHSLPFIVDVSAEKKY